MENIEEQLRKAEILKKAKKIIQAKKYAEQHLQICLKADICPECGKEGLTHKEWVEDPKDEYVRHDYVIHSCGFKHIINTFYTYDDSEGE